MTNLIKGILHLNKFKSGDKISIDSCVTTSNKYEGFHGTIKKLNLLKKGKNGLGIIEIKSSQGTIIELSGILNKLKLKKR